MYVDVIQVLWAYRKAGDEGMGVAEKLLKRLVKTYLENLGGGSEVSFLSSSSIEDDDEDEPEEPPAIINNLSKCESVQILYLMYS